MFGLGWKEFTNPFLVIASQKSFPLLLALVVSQEKGGLVSAGGLPFPFVILLHLYPPFLEGLAHELLHHVAGRHPALDALGPKEAPDGLIDR